jgi:glycosyltransferase involved in cell wall biosynthesis
MQFGSGYLGSSGVSDLGRREHDVVMISVCICTHNRQQSLLRTLKSLREQEKVSAGLEILVIDNNCTDGTAQLIQELREVVPVRRILEPKQGLSHARNRAAAEFCGDVLLFTDDDIRFDSGWLSSYEVAIRRWTDADYFFGRILPDWEGKKPRWIGKRPLPLIDGLLGWLDHGSTSRICSTEEATPFGASFAIRRRLFEKIGQFRADLGVGGSGSGRGEETEFIMRAQMHGARGVYVGEALCFHAYDPKRLGLSSLFRYGVASGRSHNAMIATKHQGSYASAGWFIVKGVSQLIRARRERFAQCVINAGIEFGTKGSAPNAG